MKKFLTFLLTLLVSIFIYNNKVEAYSESEYYYFNDIDGDSTQYYSLKSEIDYFLINDDNVSLQDYLTTAKADKLYTKFKNGDYSSYGEYAFIIMYQGTGAKLVVFDSLENIYVANQSTGMGVYLTNCTLISGSSSTGSAVSVSAKTDYLAITFNPSEETNVFEYAYKYLETQSNKIHFTYLNNMEMYNRIFKNGYNPIPDINITKERENEYILNNGNSVILNNEMKINFSSFDTSRYKYLYSYDTENWYEITENDYEFLINKNCSIYVKITDLNDNYINSSTYTTTGITENILDYLIEDGTEQGKKLTIYYYNFDNTDYHIVSNFQTGTESIYESELMGTIVYDNINLDNTYSINSYDENDNFIVGKVIDIQVDEAKLDNNRYIQLNLDKENKRLNFYYVNYKNNDKCYYKISSEEENEVNCKDNMLLDITKNGYIEIYIKNNNEIVLKRGVNVNFIDNLPQFKFQSYYNDSESKQVLKIVVENLQSDDKIYYSYDKEIWNQLETKRINYLDFYVSKEVYFKVERNKEIVSEAYFDLVYKAYENSSTNNNNQQYNGLKGLLKYFKDITKNITNAPFELGKSAYELLRQSKFGLYILLIIVSSIIILFIKSIKR